MPVAARPVLTRASRPEGYRLLVLRRVVAPLLIAVLALSTAAVGLVGAHGIRADQKRAAAAAALRREVAAYRQAISPLVVRVFDAVQPMQDVDADVADYDKPGFDEATDDVLAHSGVVAAIDAVSAGLAAQRPPVTVRAAHAQLVQSLQALRAAARTLDQATRAKGDKSGYVAMYDTGYSQLSSAETGWLAAVRAAFGVAAASPSPLPVPTSSRLSDQGRRTPTRGGFILAADLACGRAFKESGAADAIKDAPRGLRAYSASVRRVITSLRALPAPPADAALVSRLRVRLAEAGGVADAMTAIAAGLDAHDQAAVQRAEQRVGRFLPVARDLDRVFTGYGATVCGSYFHVDDLLAPPGKGRDQLTA